MKINFFYSMFLITILASGFYAYGDDVDDDYDYTDYEMMDVSSIQCSDSSTPQYDLGELIKVKCAITETNAEKKKDMCKCIEENAQANILIKVQGDTIQSATKLLEAQREIYRERFFDAYSQMTMQSTIQSRMLKIKDDVKDKFVGCSAKRISSDITNKIASNGEKNLKILKKLEKKYKDSLTDCKEGCAKKKKIYDQVMINKRNLEISMDPCQVSIELLRRDLSKEKIQKMKDYYSSKNDQFSMQRLALLSKTFYGEDTDKAGFTGAFKLVYNTASTQYHIENPCEFLDKFNKDTLEPYQKSLSDAGDGGEILGEQCGEKDSLCQSFNQINAKVDYDLNDKFTSKSTDCISQEEFETFKGMPGKELLEALAKENPENLLTIPTSSNSELEKQRVKFLRSNPILAKFTQNNKLKEALGGALQKFAQTQNDSAKTTKDKFNDYLFFMKNDVAKLLENPQVKSLEANVCNSLSDNFTAIQIANDLPDLEKPLPTDTYSDQLTNAMISCKKIELNEASSTDTGALLKTSPLFTLGMSDSEKNQDQAGFDKMKDEICKGYTEAYAAASCEGKMDDACRTQYLATVPSAEIGKQMDQGLFSGLNEGFLNVVKDIREKKSIVEVTKEVVNDARSHNDERKQDHEFIKWWDQNVGSKLSKQVIATRGEGNKFIADQKRNFEIASSTKVPDRFNYPGGSSTSPLASAPGIVPSPVSSDTSNLPGQQIPDYAKDIPSFDPSKLASAKGPKDLIPNFDKLPPLEQKQSLSDVKNFIATQENPPFSEKVVDQELSQVNEKIANNIQEIEKKIQKISNTNAPASTSQAGGQNSFVPKFSANTNVGIGPQQLPSSNVSSGSSASSAKVSSATLASNATNKALLQANESKDDSTGSARSPASLKAESGINFQKGVFDPALLPAGLLVNEEVLTPSTHEEYQKIKENLDELKNYLAGQIDVKELKEPKILKIKDPKESPNSYILFYVTKGPTGLINVKTVNRKSTLRELNNTL